MFALNVRHRDGGRVVGAECTFLGLIYACERRQLLAAGPGALFTGAQDGASSAATHTLFTCPVAHVDVLGRLLLAASARTRPAAAAAPRAPRAGALGLERMRALAPTLEGWRVYVRRVQL